MAIKQKPKLINCPVKPKPPGGPRPGQKIGPSVEGAPELTLFERAIDPFQTGADLAGGNPGVLGSNSADAGDTTETQQSVGGLSFTAGSAKIKTIKFFNPNDITVGGAEPGSIFTWTVDAAGHKLEGRLGGPGGDVAIIITLSGPFTAGPGGTVSPTITATLTDAFPHESGNGANNIEITGIHVRATDKNNKKATGDVTVDVIDDLPDSSLADENAPEMVADESPVPPDGDGVVTATGDFSTLFNPVVYGADGPGTTKYSLDLTGDDVGSGLFALDPTDTDDGDGDGYGQGAEIVLNQGPDGVITGSVGGDPYFTISIDEDTGVVTFTIIKNVWHGDDTDHDDTVTMQLEQGAFLTVVQTVTDGDDDVDSSERDISGGIFSIQDDGPDANDDGPASVDEGQSVIIDVLANDDFGTDGGSVANSVIIISNPANGTVLYNGDGTFTYTSTGPAGPDSFTYQIIDTDGDTDTATVTINVGDVGPSINVEKTADPTEIGEGVQSVTYTYVVTNTSAASTDDELTLTVLVDDRGTPGTDDDVDLLDGFVDGVDYGNYYVSGDDDGDYKVDDDESWTFQYITDVDLDAPDNLTNIVTVTGRDDENTSASDTDDATVTAGDVAPEVTVDKTASPTTIAEGGQSVTYTYEVTNTSSSPNDDELTLTLLVDDRGTPGTGDDIDLLEGFVDGVDHGNLYISGDTDDDYKVDDDETWTFQYTTDILLNGGGSLTNTVTVTATDDEGTSDSDTDDATVTARDVDPSIQVVKTADPTEINEGGEDVTYTYQVTNTSTASTDDELTLTSLVDDRGTPDTGDDVDLLEGFVDGVDHGNLYVSGDTDGDFKVDDDETWTFQYTTNVDLNGDQTLTNVVTVTGEDDEGTEATDTDDAIVTGDDVPQVGQHSLLADEDQLPAGHQDLPAPSTGDDSESNLVGNLPVDFGADSAGAVISFAGVHLTAVTDTSANPVLTSDTDSPLTYFWDGANKTLYASTDTTNALTAAATAAFSLVITDDSTGAYTFSLIQALEHDPGAGATDDTEDPNIDLSLGYTATDGEGDSSPGTLGITIDDDIPIEFDPEAVSLDDAPGATATAFLDTDQNIDDNVGADQVGTITFANITDGDDSGLTSGGVPILLFLVDNDSDPSNDGTNPPILEGRLATDNSVIFTVTLNHDASGDDTYTVEMVGTVDNGSGVEFSSLTGTGAAGNPTFKVIESSSDDPIEVLVTATDLDSDVDPTGTTVNSDANDIGLGGGQTISPSDPALRIDYGTFTIVGDDFQIDTHTNVNGAGFQLIDVVPGNPTTEIDVKLTVYDANDDEILNNDPKDTINKVQVLASDGVTVLAEATGDGTVNGFDFDFDGVNGVTVANLLEDQRVVAYTADGFNRLEIDNVTADGNNFSVGGLTVATINTGDPITINYDLALTDSDGDQVIVPNALDITLEPAGTPLALDDTAVVPEGGQASTNVVLVVDISTSMQDDPGVPGFATRVELARAAILELLQNTNIENVAIVRFRGAAIDSDGSSADPDGGDGVLTWMTRADAITFASNPANFDDSNISDSGTDYDAALNFTMSEWTAPPPADQTLAYFLSDGEPNEGDDTVGIDAGETTVWENFLTTNSIDQSFAVGIGAGATLSTLAPIAFPNGDPDNPVVLTDEGDLFDTLGTSLPGSVSGNVLLGNDNAVGGGDDDSFGPDGPGYIKSITVDGVTYTFDGVGSVSESGATPVGYVDNGTSIVVPTALGGQLTFYFTDVPGHAAGDWVYLSPADVLADTPEVFPYVIVDSNGDTSTANLEITVLDVSEPPSVSAVSATNTAINFTISDPDSSAFTLVNSPVAFATAFGNPALVLGANSIAVAEQVAALSGTLQVTDGTSADDVIGLYLGTSGNNIGVTAPLASSPNAMYGFGGNDNLTGGTAGDVMVGGIGDDTLNGAGGNDTYIFGLTDGADTISDSGGTDHILIDTNGAALTALNIADSETDDDEGNLVITYNANTITVVDHFETVPSGFQLETISFDGGSFAGYALGSDPYTISVDQSGTNDEGAGLHVIASDAGGTTVDGGAGNDLLFGNAGNDTLIGGADTDLLVGGGGDDIFDFNAVTESGSLATADVIADFQGAGVAGGDQFNFETIDVDPGGGDDDFTFGGSSATILAEDVIYFTYDGGNDRTIVQASTDANLATAEFVIILNGNHTLVAGDFADL